MTLNIDNIDNLTVSFVTSSYYFSGIPEEASSADVNFMSKRASIDKRMEKNNRLSTIDDRDKRNVTFRGESFERDSPRYFGKTLETLLALAI